MLIPIDNKKSSAMETYMQMNAKYPLVEFESSSEYDDPSTERKKKKKEAALRKKKKIKSKGYFIALPNKVK